MKNEQYEARTDEMKINRQNSEACKLHLDLS